MADSASESDSSSVEMGSLLSPAAPSKEQLLRRNESLQQENRVLKTELETYKLRVRSLQEENRALKQASVNILAKAEQEEEYISNNLMKQINTLKKEKEKLAQNYEQEEECLTNDLSRKLTQLRHEKANLEQTLEQEQEALVNKLMRRIQKLEADIRGKQNSLEQLRREKVELENTLEQEQEALVNRLWKRMDKLESEKRLLQERLDENVSSAQFYEDIPSAGVDITHHLSLRLQNLRNQVVFLKQQLASSEQEHSMKMSQLAMDEKQAKEENLRLQKKLQKEVEHREALCRQLSESESSLEMEEERQCSDMPLHSHLVRPRAGSTPIINPSFPRPISPGFSISNRSMICAAGLPHSSQCSHCSSHVDRSMFPTERTSSSLPSQGFETQPTGTIVTSVRAKESTSEENFVKPAPPPHHPNI